jgi:transcriptional regulator with XRE-family HTH domain
VTVHESSVRSRELGARLRQAMAAAEISAKDMSVRMGLGRSSISLTLSGRRSASVAEVAAILGICGIIGAARNEVLALCNEHHHDTRAYRVDGDRRWTSLAEQIAQTDQVTEFAPVMVPWMLQTHDYTRALAVASGIEGDAVPNWMSARAHLRGLLGKAQPPRLVMVLHEWVLRTPVGDRSVMSTQIHELLRISVLPAVSLRVVPVVAGAHAGFSGGFSLLEFGEYRPAVYREDATSGAFLEGSAEVTAHRRMRDRLLGAALDEEATRTLLTSVAVELYAEDGHLHDFACGGVA